MTHLPLFSGVGGIDLAAEWAGFTTVAFVEKEPYCQQVLRKNFPGVPIYDDITTFDAKPFRGRVTLVSGGFPCQDLSLASKARKGLEGERSGLWFEMLRCIEQARPAFCLCENTPGLLGMGIDVCIAGLESAGYRAGTFVIPACGVGAWHRRERVFLVGRNLNRDGESNMPEHDEVARVPTVPHPNAHSSRSGQGHRETVASPELRTDKAGSRSLGQQAGHNVIRGTRPDSLIAGRDFGARSRLFEPKLCRDIHGIPGGVDRLRALGNAVVPQQVYPILKAIANCEGGKE